jgi:predicted small metal-binding protein
VLRLLCREIGTHCNFVGRGQTEEELLMQSVGHLVKVHHLSIEDVMTPEVRENIRFHMRRFPG